MKRYTDSHEWIRIEGAIGTVGITHFAQDELGEIVYVEFPAVGSELKAGEEAAVLESTKAATDLYAPVSGKVTAVNEALRNTPSLINRSAEDQGWLYRLHLSRPGDAENLLTEEQYQNLVS